MIFTTYLMIILGDDRRKITHDFTPFALKAYNSLCYNTKNYVFSLRFKSFIELCLFIAYQKCFNPHCIATKKRVPRALVQASLLFVKYLT